MNTYQILGIKWVFLLPEATDLLCYTSDLWSINCVWNKRFEVKEGSQNHNFAILYRTKMGWDYFFPIMQLYCTTRCLDIEVRLVDIPDISIHSRMKGHFVRVKRNMFWLYYVLYTQYILYVFHYLVMFCLFSNVFKGHFVSFSPVNTLKHHYDMKWLTALTV